MNSKVIAPIVIILAIVLGGLLYLSMKPKTEAGTSASPSASATPAVAAAATFTYTADGFSPASATVKSGDSVTIINNSGSAIQVDSDPHPIHTDDTDLNVGTIAAGQSKTVVLTKTGSYGFHNHLDATMVARITVQ